MKYLVRLLITISVNVSVLAASSAWIGSVFGITTAWGSFGLGETSVRIDKHGWKIENDDGLFSIR